jgi:hypothetical protein
VDLRRLRLGEWLAGVSGLALVVLLFVPWYQRGAEPLSAWGAFAVIDVVLLLVGLLAVAVAVTCALYSSPPIPMATSSMSLIGGIVATVLMLVRLAFLPDADARLAGAWLGLIAVLGAAVGAWMALRDEGFGLRPSLDPAETHPERAPRIEATPLPEPRLRSGAEPLA